MVEVRPVYVLGAAALLFVSWDIRFLLRILATGVIIAAVGAYAVSHGTRKAKQLASSVTEHVVKEVTDFISGSVKRQFEEIRTAVTDASRRAGSFAVYVARDIQTAAVQILSFAKLVLRRAAEWVGLKKSEDDDIGNTNAPNAHPLRYLFVVSLKHGRAFGAIKSELAGIDPEAEAIDWESKEIDGQPEPKCFIRHFAICLVPERVWNNEVMTLREKFRKATFWELVGPDLIPGEGDAAGWVDEKIECIDGILKIGKTSYSNEAVSAHYRDLREAWEEYDIVWWNCFDFAIRLTYMLIPDEPTGLLGHLQMAIWNSRISYAHEAYEHTRQKSLWGKGRDIVMHIGKRVSIGATFPAGAAAPTAAAATIPVIAVIGMTCVIGVLLTMRYFNTGDPVWNALFQKKLSIWRQRNGRLIGRIDRLRGLTAELEQQLEQKLGPTQASDA